MAVRRRRADGHGRRERIRGAAIRLGKREEADMMSCATLCEVDGWWVAANEGEADWTGSKSELTCSPSLRTSVRTSPRPP